MQPTAGVKWPYQFVGSKTEPNRPHNVMDLYAYAGPLDPAELTAFCRERKALSTAQAFTITVIFDDAAHAKFPSNPVTALFGLDEETSRHIRAVYENNRANGYSELKYHPENTWDHAPEEVTI